MSNDEMNISLCINNDDINYENSSKYGRESVNREERYDNYNEYSQNDYDDDIPETFDNLSNTKNKYNRINIVIK